VAELLPGTRDLLLETLDGLKPNSEHIPELRMGKPGRSGCRYWLYGRQRKVFEGRRPAAQFEELRAAGLLRKLREDKSTGTYFAFTPAAFRERDAIAHAAGTSNARSKTRSRPAQPAPELTSAPTRLDVLRTLGEKAKISLAELIEVSKVKKTVENDPGSGVVFIPLHWWRWLELKQEDRPLLGAARKSAEKWLEACRVTLALGGPEHLEEFGELQKTVRRIYIRGSNSDGPMSESLVENTRQVQEAIDKQFALVDALPSAHEPKQLILVPDTNALLQDPDMESWQTGNQKCTIMIVSQVQAELDTKKAGSTKVAEKAASLIRRFKEYSRRGDSLEGVPLSGARCFREVPIRPNMEQAPSWLDSSQPDDCILAATLELASNHLSSRVILVTRDRGLQNKARSAECPAIDVEDL
jgi:rRNA-processing protein FCF1